VLHEKLSALTASWARGADDKPDTAVKPADECMWYSKVIAYETLNQRKVYAKMYVHV